MNIFQNSINYLKNTTAVELLVLIGLAVYTFGLFLPDTTAQYLALSGDLNEVTAKPWTLITYAFVHFRFVHLLANLIVLFYVGQIFLDFFSAKQGYLYFFGGSILGGLVFIFLSAQNHEILMGASAGIAALATGILVKVPQYAINFRFIGWVKLYFLILIFFIINILGLFTADVGAAVSHLSGMFFGVIITYIWYKSGSYKGQNKKSKTSFKKVYINKNAPKTQKSYRTQLHIQQQVDTILDKISRSGYDALSDEEKEFLKNQHD